MLNSSLVTVTLTFVEVIVGQMIKGESSIEKEFVTHSDVCFK